MDVKEAISSARTYLAMVFADEDVSDVRLEEVSHDRIDRAWLVTFGLMRPAAVGRGVAGPFAPSVLQRSYKVVRVPDDAGEMPSIRIRELVES